MKTLFKKITAFTLVLCTLFLVGCGNKYAIGKEMVVYSSQLEALMHLANDDIDAVVIDSIMGGYYTVEGDYAGQIAIVPNLVLAQEEYGIAAKAGSQAFMSKINTALKGLVENGTFNTIATQFGVNNSVAVTATTADPYASATDNSWNEIVASEKIVIGITIFAPIAFYNGTESIENLTGFDIELAKATVAYLNALYSTSLAVEFQVIQWNAKESLLENGSIDLVWNGMTITPERSSQMCISVPYLYNNQVAIVKSGNVANYTNVESFKDAIIGVEQGSAGESVVKGN